MCMKNPPVEPFSFIVFQRHLHAVHYLGHPRIESLQLFFNNFGKVNLAIFSQNKPPNLLYNPSRMKRRLRIYFHFPCVFCFLAAQLFTYTGARKREMSPCPVRGLGGGEFGFCLLHIIKHVERGDFHSPL